MDFDEWDLIAKITKCTKRYTHPLVSFGIFASMGMYETPLQ
jgi:hypothetical protein